MPKAHGEANALGNLSQAYADLGDARRAIEFYEKALVIDREIGDRRGEGAALGNLGLAYADLGEPRRATRHSKTKRVAWPPIPPISSRRQAVLRASRVVHGAVGQPSGRAPALARRSSTSPRLHLVTQTQNTTAPQAAHSQRLPRV